MPIPKPFPMPSPQHSVTQLPIAQLDTDTGVQDTYGITTSPKSKPITTWRRGLVSTPWAKSLILRKRLIAARWGLPSSSLPSAIRLNRAYSLRLTQHAHSPAFYTAILPQPLTVLIVGRNSITQAPQSPCRNTHPGTYTSQLNRHTFIQIWKH